MLINYSPTTRLSPIHWHFHWHFFGWKNRKFWLTAIRH
jgi:hypothetical protein